MKSVTIKDLLDAGIHFGHKTKRWNPKMSSYIFGERNGIHIIDLQQTVGCLNRALESLRLKIRIFYSWELKDKPLKLFQKQLLTVNNTISIKDGWAEC